MIIAVALLCMVLGALCVALGPENSWFFVLGLGLIGAVPWMIWIDLRRAKARFGDALRRAYAEAEAQARDSGRGTFFSPSGYWRVETGISAGICAYDVFDAAGAQVIAHAEPVAVSTSTLTFATDERSIRLGGAQFALPPLPDDWFERTSSRHRANAPEPSPGE